MFRKNWPHVFTLLVVFVDFLLLNFSFVLAIYLRFPEFRNPFDYWQPWLFINLIFLPIAVGLGIYRGIFQSSLENQKLHLKKFTFYLALFTMSYLFIIKGHVYSRGVVVIFLMTQYILLEIGHSLMFRLNRRMVRKGFGKKSTLIVGADKSAYNFFQALREIYGDYYEIVGFTNNGHPERDLPELKHRLVGKHWEMEMIIDRYKPEQVFIVSDSMLEKKYELVRIACENHNIPVKMVSPYIQNLMNQIKVKDVTGVPLNTVNGRPRYKKWQARIKRTFDLLTVGMASIILVPVGLLIAGLIKLTSRGPVFFKQERSLYRGGPTFLFYKFRTMYQDADRIKEKLLGKNETNGALFKMKNDPRVTPVGRFLRKYSLDEIPQFINVLKGDMSIVGPRPLPVRDFEMIKNGKVNYDWYAKRGETKPGITGLWQISGRSNLSFEEMCLLDLYYIENQSIFFDLEIIFETVPVILMSRGAY